ncbi:MAG: hypothetical protein JNJ84_15445 [Rhodobacteraceae bacterium]|nr:hypothetical protein [Paracoccaceae bacterium]
MNEAVTLHIPGSVLADPGAMRRLWGPLRDGLAALGLRVEARVHRRETVPAQIAADGGFHLIDHGGQPHPRALILGSAYIAPWYYCDPRGIRALSTIGDLTFDPDTVPEARAAAFQAELYRNLVTRRRSRYFQPEERMKVPPGCIAVFLQTEAHRGVAETCYLRLRPMIKALLARDDPRPIVVKPHPRDTDIDTFDWLARKARRDERLRIIPANIHDILAACAVVVTINSAVGIEAMVHGKPVVLCGHADFHHACVTVRQADEMDAAIAHAQVADWPHARYLSWFYQDHCLDPRRPDLAQAVLARIAATGYDLRHLGV